MALEYLTLRKLPNLIRLSREGVQNMLPRLSNLEIGECPKFLAEEESLQGLHSLQALWIWERGKFNLLACSQFLTCLKDLWIEGCREVDDLHEALQHMTALKELTLRDLQIFLLLQRLTIENCSKLRFLPTSLSLSSLERLSIKNCHPELEMRCEKETGVDSPKIAHILHIGIWRRY